MPISTAEYNRLIESGKIPSGRSFEEAARQQKATAIADLLTHFRYTLDLVRAMDDDAWHTVARCAGYRSPKPPSTETRRLVIESLERREPMMTIEEFRLRLAALELATRPQ